MPVEIAVLHHHYQITRVWAGKVRATWTCSDCGDTRTGSAHVEHPPNQDEECPYRLRAVIQVLSLDLADPPPAPEESTTSEVPCPYTGLQKPCVGAICPFWLAAHRDVHGTGGSAGKTEPTGMGCCSINPHHTNWLDPRAQK